MVMIWWISRFFLADGGVEDPPTAHSCPRKYSVSTDLQRWAVASLDVDDKPSLADERMLYAVDYKDTVNLLQDVLLPMKASLGKLEQELLQRWEQEHIYQSSHGNKYAGRPPYILRRWAALCEWASPFRTRPSIRSLKDLVVRVKRAWKATNAGSYVPGWDWPWPADRAPGRSGARRHKKLA